jgi:hypothetical protein
MGPPELTKIDEKRAIAFEVKNGPQNIGILELAILFADRAKRPFARSSPLTSAGHHGV